MKDLEECINKKEIGRLLDRIDVDSYSVDGKTGILTHLKLNPAYQCYFCDGFNYNCESYETFIK